MHCWNLPCGLPFLLQGFRSASRSHRRSSAAHGAYLIPTSYRPRARAQGPGGKLPADTYVRLFLSSDAFHWPMITVLPVSNECVCFGAGLSPPAHTQHTAVTLTTRAWRSRRTPPRPQRADLKFGANFQGMNNGVVNNPSRKKENG